MSEIKALEKLRESSHLDDNKWTLDSGEVVHVYGSDMGYPDAVNWGEQWRKIADEIEREVAQRIAELNGAVCERDGRIGSYERRNAELNDALKAICKRFGVSTEWSAEDTAKKVLEALESQYIELPVDEEGDVLRIGDELKCQGESILLNSLSWDGRRWYATETVVSSGWFPVHLCRHVKPRTLESILAELANEVWEASCACQTTWSDSGLDGIEERYADEIRAMFGEVDA